MSNSVTTSREAKPRWMRRIALILGGTLVAVLVVLQGVALALPRSNPPVIAEPPWDSPQTRELFMRACGDCHSNQTNWPWYTYVAPAAFLAYRDVTEGRQKCNVSEWGVGGEHKCDESAETIQKGTMPPWFYLPLHPEARLSPQEQQQLIQGLLATFGEGGEGPGRKGTPGGENKEHENEEHDSEEGL
ncbi:MAG: heme-binding domain-containing protein, partial [Thermomicrobium sp.]